MSKRPSVKSNTSSHGCALTECRDLAREGLLHAGDRVVEVGVEARVTRAEPGELLLDAGAGRDVELLPRAVLMELVGESGQQHVDLGALRREVGDAVDGDLRGGDAPGGRVGTGLAGCLVAQACGFVHHERDQHVLLLGEAATDRGERRRVRRCRGARRLHDRGRQGDRRDRENGEREEPPGLLHFANVVAIDQVCAAATTRPSPADESCPAPQRPPRDVAGALPALEIDAVEVADQRDRDHGGQEIAGHVSEQAREHHERRAEHH